MIHARKTDVAIQDFDYSSPLDHSMNTLDAPLYELLTLKSHYSKWNSDLFKEFEKPLTTNKKMKDILSNTSFIGHLQKDLPLITDVSNRNFYLS